MKATLRSSVLACFALCLAIDISSTSAQAANDGNRDIVRVAQIRLAELGYFTGRADGVEGIKTDRAILDFQHDNALPMTGRLTPETFGALSQNNRFILHTASYYPVYEGHYHITPDHVVVSSVPTVWEER